MNICNCFIKVLDLHRKDTVRYPYPKACVNRQPECDDECIGKGRGRSVVRNNLPSVVLYDEIVGEVPEACAVRYYKRFHSIDCQ